MNSLNKSMNSVNKQLNRVLDPLFDNQYFTGVLFIVFAVYAGMLAPRLPNKVIYFFDTILGKLIFIFLIAFFASRSHGGGYKMALIISVMFLVTLTVLNQIKIKEQFENRFLENFVQSQYTEGFVVPSANNNAAASAAGANTGGAQNQCNGCSNGQMCQCDGNGNCNCVDDQCDCSNCECTSCQATPIQNQGNGAEHFRNYREHFQQEDDSNSSSDESEDE